MYCINGCCFIFFNRSPLVWDNNAIFNKKYWDKFGSRYQRQTKDIVPQSCLCLGYIGPYIFLSILIDLNDNENFISYDPANFGQGHHLENQVFTIMMALESAKRPPACL